MKRVLFSLLFLIGSALAVSAAVPNPQGGAVTPEMRAEANKLYQAKDWTKAAEAYETITKIEPNNNNALYRLGFSLHSLGQHAKAAEAYERSVAIAANNPFALYNLACVYAVLGQTEKAFSWLEKSIAAGYTNIDSMKADAELAKLKSMPRFEELIVKADKQARPCVYDERFKQFDFWVGDWEVRTQQGGLAGRNLVERHENGCLIIENWTSSVGGTGKSVNFFDPVTGKWRQVWISSGAQIGEFAGVYKDGVMRFEGESHALSGKNVSRLTFFNLEPGRVRQLGEQTTDGGKTWTITYDFIYTLKK